MKIQNVLKGKLDRITSDPNNFGWAPLAWAYIEE